MVSIVHSNTPHCHRHTCQRDRHAPWLAGRVVQLHVKQTIQTIHIIQIIQIIQNISEKVVGCVPDASRAGSRHGAALWPNTPRKKKKNNLQRATDTPSAITLVSFPTPTRSGSHSKEQWSPGLSGVNEAYFALTWRSEASCNFSHPLRMASSYCVRSARRSAVSCCSCVWYLREATHQDTMK